MKKYIYGALFGIFLIAFLLKGQNTNGAPFLSYVYSNSMVPLIKVNDAFFVWPSSSLHAGDIIMYRPVVLKATYITHRIIALGDNGYITKGDNAYYRDQESGEPEVIKDRIVGKVIAINGQPVIIPGLGKFTTLIRAGFGRYTLYLSAVFFLLGSIMLFSGKKASRIKRKSRKRLRLYHIYRSTAMIATIIIMLSIYFGSRVSQINYLVSEYPGTRGDQIEVNRPGLLTMTTKNNGLIPVWTIAKGVQPLSIRKVSMYMKARSSKSILIDVLPQRRTGAYQGYIQFFNYPALLPKEWILFLYRIHPMFAIIVIGQLVYLIFFLCFQLLQKIPGLEGWIPLKAIEDKIMKRRLDRGIGKLVGRRRRK